MWDIFSFLYFFLVDLSQIIVLKLSLGSVSVAWKMSLKFDENFQGQGFCTLCITWPKDLVGKIVATSSFLTGFFFFFKKQKSVPKTFVILMASISGDLNSCP